jgi:perosamine synthetase
MEIFESTLSFIKELYPDKSFIPLHEPKFMGNEKAYLLNTIDSTFVSSVGAYVDQFEAMMRDYTGAKYAIAVINGTAALHISLKLAGVQQGDLVITQALSFVATCNAISYLNAEPCFVDVSTITLGMCPEALKRFLKDVEVINNTPVHKPTGKRIGACVPMHTFGFPAEIDTLIDLCNQYQIPLIEDAAESIGSTFKGKQTGTFGLLGTYSFNGNKTITCGGGGIIVTNDDVLGPLAKHLTTQAKVPHKWEFVHDDIGYNYRCPNLNAALACAQLEQLNYFIKNKRETANLYQNFFANTPISFITEPANTVSNYWLNALLLENRVERDEFLTYTNVNGVMTRPVWTLMHKLTMFAHCIHDGLNNSLDIEARLVNIPSSVR